MPTEVTLSSRAAVVENGAYLKRREYSEGLSLFDAPRKWSMMTVHYGWTCDAYAIQYLQWPSVCSPELNLPDGGLHGASPFKKDVHGQSRK